MPAVAKTYHVHIDARPARPSAGIAELWRYRELAWLFTKRNFVVTYKQTVLGPLWLVLSPLLTSVAYLVLFGRIAGLSTDGVPQLLFYLLGTAVWTFFAACVTKNATTFTANANLFGKVWFPRLIVPLSEVLGAFIRLGIQLLLVFALLGYYVAQGVVAPAWQLWPMVPLSLILLAALGMGCGILVSSLTTRYRDLAVLVSFGVSLWMYATPVVYPLSSVTGPLRTLLLINPATSLFELTRAALFGVGSVEVPWLAYSTLLCIAVVLLGTSVFARVERTFVDTV